MGLQGREIIDAIRISDGTAVMIKKVPYRPGSREVKIATILSSPENLKDRRNHCIPILDSFHDTIDDPRLVFLVMPKLHSSNDPHPKSVGDVVEFMRQTLEGLEFMHGRDIAHRDISLASIMVDSDTRKQSLQHSISEKTNTNHVRYFISNFESCQDLNTLPTFKSVAAVPERGQYPPELSGDNDVPFSGDVFALGTLFKKNFITPYSNFDTLIPLIKQMTARDPKKRPSMAVARSRFEMLVRNWNGSTLRWRLRPTHEKIGPRFVRTCAAIVREVLHLPSRVATSASLLMKQQSLRFLTKVHYAFRPYQIATF
ncbi:hypothetical protein BD410DRAFT_730572 [Rickenella mellea]|uniref:Protein kinase domain-containing protein n=1 Tax=Rickenella mellea TaxID=50990 RepID=A0A4Y7PQZ7_9AGAM|nr:hypothetical protein BD410DRAFT_730572 [Rickenella mellea]